MNLYYLLETEHRRLRDLFRRMESAADGGPGSLAREFRTLARELLIHCEAEESFLYSRLRACDETRDAALESQADHKEMKRRIAALEAMDAAAPEWEPAARELRETCTRHFDRDERELFPRARLVIGDEEAAGIAEDIGIFKEEHAAVESE